MFLSPSICMNSHWCQCRCRYSYPGTLLFNKVIFVFLYLNICYLNASLSCYGSSTGIFILQRGYTERWLGLRGDSEIFDGPVSFHIRGSMFFFKTNWMCPGILHTSMLNYYKKSYTVTWALLMNLLEHGSFRVYCTVYEYPQITRCYLTNFGHYNCFVCFYVYFVPLRIWIWFVCAWNLNIFNNETSF